MSKRKRKKTIPVAAQAAAEQEVLRSVRDEFLDRSDQADWVREGLPLNDIRFWPHEIHSWGWSDVDEYAATVSAILTRYE